MVALPRRQQGDDFDADLPRRSRLRRDRRVRRAYRLPQRAAITRVIRIDG